MFNVATKHWIAGFAGAFAATGLALAKPIDDAEAALKRQDFTAAARVLKPLAEAGDPVAQSELGWLFLGRSGVKEDNAQALLWTRKAADQGYGPAQKRLLLLCYGGQIYSPTDCGAVMAELKVRSDNGDPKAQLQLGTFMLTGRGGFAKDAAEGLRLLQKAADQELVDAERQLGLVYSNGYFGVPADASQSLAWYRKAADHGDVASMDALAMDYSMGMNGLPRDGAQAAALYQTAADKGDFMAQSFLAKMYETGDGIAKDDAKAFALYRKLAENGLPDDLAKVGAGYAMGKGITQDDVMAYAWFDVALSNATPRNNADSYKLARNAVATKLTPAKLVIAKHEAKAIKSRIDARLEAEEQKLSSAFGMLGIDIPH
jgi:TPR repeat protein